MKATRTLTKDAVEKAKPGDQEYSLWDKDIPGFGLRVWPSGRKVFVIMYRNASRHKKRFTVGPFPGLTVQQARDRAREILAMVTSGQDPQSDKADRRTGLTVGEFFVQYMAHVEAHQKPTTVASYRFQINRFVLPEWGPRRLDSITLAHVQQLHHSMRDTPYAANQVHSILRAAFTLAVKWGLLEKNPASGVAHYREKSRERFLSAEELLRAFEVLTLAETAEGYTYFVESGTTQEQRTVRCSPFIAGAIRLLALTGARKNEIVTARWQWLDWEQSRLDLPDSKTGKKSIYLPREAIEVLRGLHAIRTGEWIIPGKKGPATGVSIAWDLVREAAGLPGVRLHDLRHSYASFLIARGMSLPFVGKLLGHTQTATTQRYAHLADDPLRVAVTLMDDVLAEGRSAAKKSG